MTQASALADDELMQEARTARMELGLGELPLHDFIDALPPEVELEYEVVNTDSAGLTPAEKAHAARIDIDRFMNAHRSRRSRHPAVA